MIVVGDFRKAFFITTEITTDLLLNDENNNETECDLSYLWGKGRLVARPIKSAMLVYVTCMGLPLNSMDDKPTY